MCKIRCKWAQDTEEIYIRYHDEEWGKPVYDDTKLFEMLLLESFQAGLSWLTILKKRGKITGACQIAAVAVIIRLMILENCSRKMLI